MRALPQSQRSTESFGDNRGLPRGECTTSNLEESTGAYLEVSE